jgi:hypothetical protein
MSRARRQLDYDYYFGQPAGGALYAPFAGYGIGIGGNYYGFGFGGAFGCSSFGIGGLGGGWNNPYGTAAAHTSFAGPSANFSAVRGLPAAPAVARSAK